MDDNYGSAGESEREDPLSPQKPIYKLDPSPQSPLHPTTSSYAFDEDRTSPTPSLSSSNSLFSSRPKPPKRKRVDDDEDVENIAKRPERGASQPDDEDVRFGRTVADALRKFTRKQKSMAKFQIHRVLFEMEQSALTDDDGRGMNT